MRDHQRNFDQALVNKAAMKAPSTTRTSWITSSVDADRFNLNPKPERTQYREAIILPPFDGGDVHYPEVELIRTLAEKDKIFMRRLDEDKAFHDMFWFYSMVKWEPHTEEEESALDAFNTAVSDRLELVIAQKVMLGRYFHLLCDEKKKQSLQLVMEEMRFMNLWLRPKLPKYDYLWRKFCIVHAMDFNKEDHNPDDPIGRFNLDG